MPYYDYHCNTCDATFTERRSYAQADTAAVCACGSANTHKLLSAVAFTVAGGSSRSSAAPSIPLQMSGGGCCGGSCGCG